MTPPTYTFLEQRDIVQTPPEGYGYGQAKVLISYNFGTCDTCGAVVEVSPVEVRHPGWDTPSYVSQVHNGWHALLDQFISFSIGPDA